MSLSDHHLRVRGRNDINVHSLNCTGNDVNKNGRSSDLIRNRYPTAKIRRELCNLDSFVSVK